MYTFDVDQIRRVIKPFAIKLISYITLIMIALSVKTISNMELHPTVNKKRIVCIVYMDQYTVLV